MRRIVGLISLSVFNFSLLFSNARAPETRLKEVAIAGGKAVASSLYDINANAASAFNRNNGNFWHSGRNAEGKGNLVYPFPHLVWYEFPTPFVPGRVSFRPRQSSGCGSGGYWCGATKWQFIASNDPQCNEMSVWTVLCEDLSGKPFERSVQSKYCVSDPTVDETYRCVGISVLDASYPGYACVSVNGMRIWEKIFVKN